jgi:aspartate-semialdehyde dehydrogenase
VHATCVRVPTFIGHAEAINLELAAPLEEDDARRVLAAAPGLLVVDRREPGGYITPQEVTGQDAVFVSRVRVDPTVENGLSLWVVSDNLRKGAALNAVQIAEELIKSYI